MNMKLAIEGDGTRTFSQSIIIIIKKILQFDFRQNINYGDDDGAESIELNKIFIIISGMSR